MVNFEPGTANCSLGGVCKAQEASGTRHRARSSDLGKSEYRRPASAGLIESTAVNLNLSNPRGAAT